MPRLEANYLRLLREFRGWDLVQFYEEHDRLFKEAEHTKDYLKVTEHYYELMTSVIESSFGASFHFSPPEHSKQSHEEALKNLHIRIARMLLHSPGKVMLDVGCGVGQAMLDVAAYSGGKVVGITLSQSEIEAGRSLVLQSKLQHLVTFVQGDFLAMPFEDETFDSAYAIYSLKYFVDLSPAFRSLYRVLKAGGLFLVYDIVKTEKYDSGNPESTDLVDRFEYYCGMPPLHTNKEMIDVAGQMGFECISQMDLSKDYPWYYCFIESPFFYWLISSRIIAACVLIGERLRLLPRGFKRFNDIFLSGTVRAIVEAGRADILSGSNILIFQKPHR